MFKLKPDEICPLEKICAEKGTAAKKRKPVKEVCNADDCRFYFTHPNSTPAEFETLFRAAMTMRENKLCELREANRQIENEKPFWYVAAYRSFERAYRVAEAKHQAEQTAEKPDATMDVTRGKRDGAFAAIIEAKEARRQREQSAETSDAAELEIFFENNPAIELETLEYFLTGCSGVPEQKAGALDGGAETL